MELYFIRVMPSTKWSLGITSEDGHSIVIIPKGTTIPASISFEVTTIVDGQTNIGLDIRLGERTNANENFPISDLKLEYIEIAPKRVPRVKLTFWAFEHNVFKLWVCYKEGEKSTGVLITPTIGLSEQEIADLQKAVAKMIEETPIQPIEGLNPGILPLPAKV
jgi:Molecular chaperone